MLKVHRKRYYFAFGSNMLIEQMAERCPTSLFEGTAILHGHRWHINTRGVANVVRSREGHWVEGLVFSVYPKDVETLDRKEGVRRGLYEKFECPVYLDKIFSGGMEIAQLSLALQAGDNVFSRLRGGIADGLFEPRNKKILALVYISPDQNTGQIREEYARRMSRAARDAWTVGVSAAYIARYLRPAIEGTSMTMEPIAKRHSLGQNERVYGRGPGVYLFRRARSEPTFRERTRQFKYRWIQPAVERIGAAR